MKMAAPEGAAISWVQVFEEDLAVDDKLASLRLGGERGLSVADNRLPVSVLALESAAYGRRAFSCRRTNQRHAGIITKHLNGFQQLIFAF